MFLEGFIKTGTRTKDLIKYLSSKDIAVIKHDDIDELAAEALIASGIKAIINTGKSMTGKFASRGTALIVNSNILLYDTTIDIDHFKDGDFIKLNGKDMILNNQWFINACIPINEDYIQQKLHESCCSYTNQLSCFLDNSIQYIKQEKASILDFKGYPELNTAIAGRCAIVVVRSIESKECLHSLKDYIERERPVLIGVDGGADIIISCGFIPDILIGDMDSVSDVGIFRSKELILHAYTDGSCPCLNRIMTLNIKYKVLPMPGTSEDIALLLAYDKGAANILLIGGHSCAADFLERGRLGMGSTIITRLKVEDRLIDYRQLQKLQHLLEGKSSEADYKAEGDLACVKM